MSPRNVRPARAGASAPAAPGARVRMEEVARAARVSTMTVSRALRAPQQVADGTRERILKAVAELRYVPDQLAAGLAARKTRFVAALVPTLADSIFADTLQGVSDVMRARGYELLVGSTRYDDQDELRLTSTLLGRRPDGLILTGVDHRRETIALLRESHIPVVETWGLSKRPIDCVVGFSNVQAGRQMTEHLADAGYRHIVFVGGADRRALQRKAGHAAALRARRQRAIAHVVSGLKGLEGGATALEEVLCRQPGTDAVFLSSDILAAGALEAARRNGWSVPGRVAIAGLGDFEIASYTSPPLTTVKVPRYEMGARAGELLLDRIDGRTAAGVVVDVGFSIVERQST